MDHVRKPLTFKTRLSAKPFMWKLVLFAWEYWIILFISTALHLASLWNRGLDQLGNGLFKATAMHEFRAKFLAFCMSLRSPPASSLNCLIASQSFNEERRVFLVENKATAWKLEKNNFVYYIVTEENCRELTKQQQKGRKKVFFFHFGALSVLSGTNRNRTRHAYKAVSESWGY